MESCPTFKLQYKRNDKYNHKITKTNLAANNQNYSQQCERIKNLPDKSFQLQTNEITKKTNVVL